MQSSQSPQGLRTPGRHGSLVALSSLLPFPLKEAAAPGAQGRPQVSAGGPQLPTDFCLPLLIAGVELPPAPAHGVARHLQCTYWRQWAVSARKAKGESCFIPSLIIKVLQARQQGGSRHFWKKDEEGLFPSLTPQPESLILLYTEPRLGVLRDA